MRDDVNAYNPGSQYWDVASLDNYNSDGGGYAQWKHDVMVEVAGGKPIAIGECSKLPTLNNLSSQARWTFFMSWSELLLENNSEDEIIEVYSGDQVLTLEEMPDWRNSDAASLRSFHNTYLSAWNDGGVRLQPAVQAWESWTVEHDGNGKVAFKSFHNNYLSAWPDGSVMLQPQKNEWEYWTEVQNSDGTVSFSSFHGTFLSAWPDGTVNLQPQNQDWEHWSM